jgi:DNA-binding NtrC family response regulator
MAVGTVLTAERPISATVLIVDDEDATRSLCHDVVTDSALRTRKASTTEQALEILDQMSVDILITDQRVPQLGGLELLKRVRSNYPQTAVLVLTQYGTIESAVEATRLGAADYITKPFHIPELRSKLDRMIRLLDVDQENRVLRETLRTRPGFADLIGVSVKMQRVYRLIERVSRHTYPVLILGESGTDRPGRKCRTMWRKFFATRSKIRLRRYWATRSCCFRMACGCLQRTHSDYRR